MFKNGFQVILLVNDFKDPEESLGNALKKTPSFWLVVVFTGKRCRYQSFQDKSDSFPLASLILPWVELRHHDVRAEVLSNHAVQLFFDYGGESIHKSLL